jgi:hypothetical protein
MTHASDVIRQHRTNAFLGLGVALFAGTVCFAIASNAWTNAGIAVIVGMTLIELQFSRRIAGPTDADTLRREIRLMRWAPLWYAVPMTAAPLLMIEGASRMVGEHAPMPIVAAVLAVGVGALISIYVAMRRLERELSTRT